MINLIQHAIEIVSMHSFLLLFQLMRSTVFAKEDRNCELFFPSRRSLLARPGYAFTNFDTGRCDRRRAIFTMKASTLSTVNERCLIRKANM